MERIALVYLNRHNIDCSIIATYRWNSILLKNSYLSSFTVSFTVVLYRTLFFAHNTIYNTAFTWWHLHVSHGALFSSLYVHKLWQVWNSRMLKKVGRWACCIFICLILCMLLFFDNCMEWCVNCPNICF